MTPSQAAAVLTAMYIEFCEKKGYTARINDETVPVRVVDVDPADNRAYVETFPGSEIRCLPLEQLEAAEV